MPIVNLVPGGLLAVIFWPRRLSMRCWSSNQKKHQFVLDLDRKSGTALAAFDEDQLLEILFTLAVTPQPGDGLDDAGKGFERGGFTGTLAFQHFALAKHLLRQRGIDDSVIDGHLSGSLSGYLI